MNIPKLSSLSPERKNILIAEMCGKRVIATPFSPGTVKPDSSTCFTDDARRQWRLTYPRGANVQGIPNYIGSLDACAEMRKALTEEQYVKYAHKLMWQVGLSQVAFTDEIAKALVRATPTQHVDATLLATGKAEM